MGHISGSSPAAPIPSDEARLIGDLLRRTGRHGGFERCRGFHLAGDHPRTRAQVLERARDSGDEPSATERHQHLLHMRQIFENLGTDRGIAAITATSDTGWMKRPCHALEPPLQQDPPPALERHRHDLRSQPIEGGKLGLRCMIGHDGCEGNASGPGAPGQPKRHVPRARGVDPLGELGRLDGADRIPRAADLNDPTGCRVSSLSQMSRGPSKGSRTSGVRMAVSLICSRA
jgi:hypothetical protein